MVMTGKEAQKRLKKQYKRQNEHIKANYKRLSITVKNEVYKDIIEIYGDKLKMNSYINNLIMADLESKQRKQEQNEQLPEFMKD